MPFALRQREPHALFAFPIHQRQLLLPRQRRVFQQLEQQPAEMLEHRLRDRAALVGRLLGERHLEIRERDSPVHAIDEIEHQPEPFAEPAHDRERQGAHDQRDRRDGDVLDLMPHALTRRADRAQALGEPRRERRLDGDLERDRDDLGSDPVPVRGQTPNARSLFLSSG